MTATSTEQKTMSTIYERALAFWNEHEPRNTEDQYPEIMRRFALQEVRRERERCAGVLDAMRASLERSRDKARAAGRERVAECRQSDCETLERAAGALRSLPDEDGATAASEGTTIRIERVEDPQTGEPLYRPSKPVAAPQEESMGDEIEKRAREVFGKCACHWTVQGGDGYSSRAVVCAGCKHSARVAHALRQEAARARREALDGCCVLLSQRAAQAEDLSRRSLVEPAHTVWKHRAIEARQSVDVLRALSDSTAATEHDDGRARVAAHPIPNREGEGSSPSAVANQPGPAAAPLTEQQAREIAIEVVESRVGRAFDVLQADGREDRDRINAQEARIEALERHDTSDPRVLDAIQSHAKRIAEVERYIDDLAPKPPSTYASVTDKEGTTRVLIDDDPLGVRALQESPVGQIMRAVHEKGLGQWPMQPPPADSGKTGGEIAKLLEWLRATTLSAHNDARSARWATAVEALQAENAELRRINEALRSNLPKLYSDANIRDRRVMELEAENAELARIAGEALGTDPEHRTAVGCVKALAAWSETLRADNARLRGWLHAMRAAWKFHSDERGSYPTAALRGDPVPDGKLTPPPAPEPLPVRFMEKLRAAALNNNFEHVERCMWAIPSEWRALLARVEART